MHDSAHQYTDIGEVDADIAEDHALYLRATWAGHSGEAEWYRVEVDRLRNLRDTIERGVIS
jgi:hypothetical protein